MGARNSSTESLIGGRPRSRSPSLHPVAGPTVPSKTIFRADNAPRLPQNKIPNKRPPSDQLPKVQILKKWWEPSLDTRTDSSTNVWPLCESDLGLTDIPENENNASLWLSQLVSAKREHGRDGVLLIWEAMEKLRSLRDVTSEEAQLFWSAILEAVLHDEDSLKDVVLFSEWLLRTHSAQWPSLYSKTISYCLRNGQYLRAMQWHLRLMPNFDPGPERFGALLQEFAIVPRAEMQQTLQALYVASLHHSSYDELIPLLYRNGLSQHCNGWRDLFINHHDLPQPTAESQPYLKYLARYYPTITLELEEQMIVGLNSSTYWDVHYDSLWDAMKQYTHGDDSDSPGRRHSDTLGARWFASSWVPLDFAIHAVHALGVRQIGPLSLQSIALREPIAHRVVARIEQLRKINIDIGYSAYSQVLKRFAENEDNELLHELLHTDIHPDVFDDPPMLASIRDKALKEGAWETHRLLVAIQPAIVEDSVDLTSNLLLQESVKYGQSRQALALLDDMRTMNIDVSMSTVQHICWSILDILPWNPKTTAVNQEALNTAIAYLTRLTLLKKPVHSHYWQKIIFGLGKFGRIGELEELCIGIIDTYEKLCISEGGLLPVHYLDAPPLGMDGSTNDVLVPADLPIAHEHHPVRRIFDNAALHAAIVRWGFKAGFSKSCSSWGPLPSSMAAASEYSVARGVRFLAILNGRGIPFRAAVVQDQVVRCLARAYLPQNKGASRRKVDLPPLKNMSELVNRAAGRDLLPSTAKLRDLMEDVYPGKSTASMATRSFTTPVIPHMP